MIYGTVVWVAWPPIAILIVLFAVRRRTDVWHTLGALFLATYALWIASAVFFPMPVVRAKVYSEFDPSVNLVPFRCLLRSFEALGLRELIRLNGGNFLLLVPFTLLGPLLWPRLRAWRMALTIGVGATAVIELLQLAFSAVVGYGYRSVDIDDLIVNTAGALFGYALFVGGRRVIRAWTRESATCEGFPGHL